ncbi:MAG TPA: hypothetical protein VK712_03310 [Verrucomicrobiae bacterium]|jgi:hypothetical protein|nr:hypothetical protein [Verrucomicrobiae bacterium]
MPHISETGPTHIDIPEQVQGLFELGYIETNPLFNVTHANQDATRRYDLIHPDSDMRILWTPPSDPASMELIEAVIGSEDHPIFFPLLSRDATGDTYKLPNNVRLLENTLETSPYIPEYMERLERKARAFMEKLAILDAQSFGLDTLDLVINHNGDKRDDVFLSVVPPVQPPTDSNFSLSNAYKLQKRRAIQRVSSGESEQ